MGRLKKYYNNNEKRGALNEASHRYYLRNKEEKNAKDLARYYKKKAEKEAAAKLELYSSSISQSIYNTPATGSDLNNMLEDCNFNYCSGSVI